MKTRRPFLFAVSILAIALMVGCSPPPSSQPLIGISTKYDVKEGNHFVPTEYTEAVINSGGTPVYVPMTTDPATLQLLVERLDGLIMVGGRDIPPKTYGEEPVEHVKEMPAARFESDQKLIKLWLATKKPMFGVCLGMQQTNLASGGSMIQDLPTMVGDEVIHRDPENKMYVYHPIQIVEGSLLERIVGRQELEVASRHHQAVNRLGDVVRPAARSRDGVVEALELTDRPWGLLVQFHPEQMTDTDAGKAIFRSFVEACKEKFEE